MKKSGSGGVELGHFARRGSLLPSNTWCICCWGGGGYRTTMDAWVWVVSVVLKGVPGIVGMSNLKPITKC